MSELENPSKEPCFIPLLGFDCPENCIGRLALDWVNYDENHPEGVMVQVCQNPDKSGSAPQSVDYCGNGADVMTFYQTTPATKEQINQELEGWGW